MLALILSIGIGQADVSANAQAIRTAATAPNFDENGHRPLPLFASWNVGGKGDGYTPKWQKQMLEAGHKILPWFPLEHPTSELSKENRAVLATFAEWKLPIAFVSTQWEHILSTDKKLGFINLPESENPNVIGGDGIPQRRVSAFGSIDPWRQAGAIWGAAPALQTAQEIHPDPGRLLLISNNEHAKLRWTNIDDDRRFTAEFGTDKTDEEKRKIIGEAWIKRYRALQDGIRSSLNSQAWKQSAIFVGYNAFGIETIGRWPGWHKYSLHIPGRFSPWPLAWDGGAPSFYTNNWEMATDYSVFSPQVQCMNWVFMLKQAYKLNPNFWFEMSLWDGHTPKKPNDKYRFYADRGQKYSPQRYAGMAQFGMWLLRPRVVREFRGYLETREENGEKTEAVIAAVDRIHDDPVLAEFWKKGQLVPNRKQKHPYVIGIPEEYMGEDRWFRLSTDQDPKGNWKLTTDLNVFALALVQGEKPKRQWLVYSHAPLGDKKTIQVTIPEYKPVTVDATVGGSYWIVDEETQSAKKLPMK